MDQHNGEIEQLIGKGYTKSTWTKYNTTKKHILDFLQWKYQISDLDIRELRYEFNVLISSFVPLARPAPEFHFSGSHSRLVDTSVRFASMVRRM